MSEEDEIVEGNRSENKNTGETTEKDSSENKEEKIENTVIENNKPEPKLGNNQDLDTRNNSKLF